MKVNSELADIEFGIGRLRRQGDNLIISSDAASTMPTQIIVTPADARTTLKKMLFSGSFWRFLAGVPFGGRGSTPDAVGSGDGDNPEWQARRSGRGLNKPW